MKSAVSEVKVLLNTHGIDTVIAYKVFVRDECFSHAYKSCCFNAFFQEVITPNIKR
jgi:hypothetical protein